MNARLGHATASFTLSTNCHVIPDLDEHAANTIASLILRSPEDSDGEQAVTRWAFSSQLALQFRQGLGSPAVSPYEALLNDVVDHARWDEEILGVLLTGSVARGDVLPGADLDIRFILAEGGRRPFRREIREGVLVEEEFDDENSARVNLETHHMNIYAYLDGRILYDPRGIVARLRRHAQRRFDAYQISEEERSNIAFLLQCSRHKISVALTGGDLLKAAFVTGTSSWAIMEGLWAANNLPLPPNSSVRPHLRDLSHGPPDVEKLYEKLFLAETPKRIDAAIELIDWILTRMGAPIYPPGKATSEL